MYYPDENENTTGELFSSGNNIQPEPEAAPPSPPEAERGQSAPERDGAGDRVRDTAPERGGTGDWVRDTAPDWDRGRDRRTPGEFAAGAQERGYVNGEYHMRGTGGGERRGCYDAGYVSSDSASAVPPTWHYSEPQPPKEKKTGNKRRGPGWAGVIAACLVCAILGGTGGGVLGSHIAARGAPAAAAADGNGTVLTVAASPAPAVSKNLISSGDVIDPSQIYTLACSQTVGVTTRITRTTFFGTSSGAVTGSGFIISSDGYILTNFHVVEDAVKGGYDVTVYFHDGTEYIASIVGYEEDNDVAVLKIDAGGLSAATIGDSDAIQVGQSAYAVGNPLGELQYTMTTGSVSALDREISFTDSDTGVVNKINMFQIDAAVNSGNSGGPVYNDRGEVIGIVTAKYGAYTTGVEGLGFAIPINDAVSIANDIITIGYVRGKAALGVTVQTVPATAVQYYNMVPGAYVMQVGAGSCAENAGVKVGDVIVAVDDTPIGSMPDLMAVRKEYRAGESAVLKVFRGGEYLDLQVTFDEDVPAGAAAGIPGGGTVPETDETPETPEQDDDTSGRSPDRLMP